MPPMLIQMRKLGWFVVEAALLLVILCVLLNLLLGRDSGAFISGVAANTTSFLQAVPPGSFLGVVLIVVLYLWARSRLS
jgi:hypothetical protein